MENTETVTLLNKVFRPVKCLDSLEALQKMVTDNDSGYFETAEPSTDILNQCDLIYDIKPDTVLEIIMPRYDGHEESLKRIIKVPTTLFTAQNPLVRCVCVFAEIHTEIPVKYKAVFIPNTTRYKLSQIPFQVGNLMYKDGRIIDVDPVL